MNRKFISYNQSAFLSEHCAVSTVGDNKCVSKTHIDECRLQLKLCATPSPRFKGNISVADCMPLYIYSKLLKLTAASNAGVYEKRAILEK